MTVSRQREIEREVRHPDGSISTLCVREVRQILPPAATDVRGTLSRFFAKPKPIWKSEIPDPATENTASELQEVSSTAIQPSNLPLSINTVATTTANLACKKQTTDKTVTSSESLTSIFDLGLLMSNISLPFQGEVTTAELPDSDIQKGIPPILPKRPISETLKNIEYLQKLQKQKLQSTQHAPATSALAKISHPHQGSTAQEETTSSSKILKKKGFGRMVSYAKKTFGIAKKKNDSHDKKTTKTTTKTTKLPDEFKLRMMHEIDASRQELHRIDQERRVVEVASTSPRRKQHEGKEFLSKFEFQTKKVAPAQHTVAAPETQKPQAQLSLKDKLEKALMASSSTFVVEQQQQREEEVAPAQHTVAARQTQKPQAQLSLKDKLEKALMASSSTFVVEQQQQREEEVAPAQHTVAAQHTNKLALATTTPTPAQKQTAVVVLNTDKDFGKLKHAICKTGVEMKHHKKYRRVDETPEETFGRLNLMIGSMDWHNQNVLAARLLRDGRSSRSSAAIQTTSDTRIAVRAVNTATTSDVNEDADEKRKRLQRERQQAQRAKQTDEERKAIQIKDSARRADARRNESVLTREALAKALSRQLETAAERENRLAAVATSMSQHRELETAAERENRLAAVATSMSQHRELETAAERENRLATIAASTAQRRQQETALEYERRLRVDAAQHRVARARAANMRRNDVQQMVERANYNEDAVVRQNCGLMDEICQYCGSHNFSNEKPSDNKFTVCCNKGKMIPKNPRDKNGVELKYPTFLETLLTSPWDSDSRNFRENIRSYNSALSFASFGAKLENVPGRGPYVFKVHGQVYHFTSHTEPRNENERSYAQLYVLDSATQAVETRMQHRANVDLRRPIVRRIHDFFRQNNSIARTYEMMREVQERETNHAVANNLTIPVVNMAMRSDRQQDERRYNLPTSNEVAMVFVNEDGEPPFHRDIRVYPRNPNDPSRPLIRLNIRDCNLDPMVYAIMFPYGQPGWHPEFLCDGVHATMLQYKRSLTAIRDEFCPIMRAGKLTQQWVVDSYLQVEAHNLEYVRFHQEKLRSELYQGLADYVNTRAAEAGQIAGRPIILPSTFEGSPRNMRQRLQDAMAIFAKYGSVDMFVTFTSNPNWAEVQENLQPGETASDRFDLVCRVFNLKLKELMADLTVHHALGKCIAWVYTIEFQKRGLPHAHILLVVEEGDKFKTAARIDEVVCAEIPNADTHPILHSIVTTNMLHICGDRCKGDDGQCSKKFPRDYQLVTDVNQKGTGYPLYRRLAGPTFVKNNRTYDNRHIVPYNKYLLLKYNAHINVEVCTSLKAVKYIYKYIYKGFDCADCTVGHIDGQEVLIHDEVTNFINGRYVSAPEAYWRLVGFKMHDRSHAVITLPVHLPRQQRLQFEEGREQEAVEAAATGQTKLTAWFKLNVEHPAARQYLYTELPKHFTFSNNKWHVRQRGDVIGRMYTVPANDEERFCLRLLLLNVRGATSYENLRTFNGIEYATFKEAAIQRKLLSSDKEFDNVLREAAIYHMPYQLRQAFAIICVYCRPRNAARLFEKYTNDMILDFEQLKYDKAAATNLALHQIQLVFEGYNTSCSSFGLPTPTGSYTEALNYDQTVEASNAEFLISTLNDQQLHAFNKIVESIDNESSHKCFYLNGPGGSGKTYLYQTLISYIRGRGQTVNAYATTGIASTLLPGGTTVHSGFGFPPELDETSTSSLSRDSVAAKNLKNASLIIIDEITMLNKNGLRLIEKFLREEVMRNNKPFGGKTLVISGDFRQTLPIVVKGSRAAIIAASISSGALWKNFQNISLISNVRSAGQNAHNKWLLNIGSGDTPHIDGLSENTVEIPAHMITTIEDIIEKTFTNDIRNLSVDELSRRVMLASTNAVALQINAKIMEEFPGDFVTYTSADKIISQGDEDERLYPMEFLNSQTPSGVPPHQLSLKLGAVVMLMRNLNKSKGLCNGTRLIVRGLYEHFIRCEIISPNHKGDIVFITRLDITASDATLPFKMQRRQFPLIPAFAITINKSQGQTYDIVGVYLDQPVFGHGQLYVALSRCKDPTNIKIFIREGPTQGQLLNDGRYFTENVVYKEIFRSTVR